MIEWLDETYKTARRAWREVRRENVFDWAAALTYHAMLALFPALIVVVTLIGLIGNTATVALLDQLEGFAPGPARDIFAGALTNIQNAGASTGVFFAIGLALAIWSASSYVAAFGRASGSIRREHDDRPFWQVVAMRLLTTVTLLVLLALIGTMVVFSGPLADQLTRLLGVGDGLSEAWGLARWPLALALFAILLSLLDYAATGNHRRRWRLVTTGSAVAIAIWVTASLVFTFYVSEFAGYSKVYGSLAGVVVFLVWLWITNVAILLGVHIDAMRAATPAEREH